MMLSKFRAHGIGISLQSGPARHSLTSRARALPAFSASLAAVGVAREP
jgi:hypothetical protein